MPIKHLIIHSISFVVSCALLTSYFLEGRSRTTTRSSSKFILPSFLRRTPAPAKTSEPITIVPKVNINEKVRDQRLFDLFLNHIRIFTHPKSNDATKTRAATQLIRYQFKTDTFQRRANKQLKKHGLSKQTLEKEIHSGTSLNQFANLLGQHQEKKGRDKDAKLSATSKRKLLTIYTSHLNPAHRGKAHKLLRQHYISITDLGKRA